MTIGSDARLLKQLQRKAIDKLCGDMPRSFGMGRVDVSIAMAEYIAARFEGCSVEDVLLFWNDFYPTAARRHDVLTLKSYAFWLASWEGDHYPNVILRRKRIAEFVTNVPSDDELKGVISPWNAFRISLVDSPFMLWSERERAFEPMLCLEAETEPGNGCFIVRAFSKTAGFQYVESWEEPDRATSMWFGPEGEAIMRGLRGILWNTLERVQDDSLRTDLRSRALSKTFKQSDLGKRFGHRKLHNFLFTEDVHPEPDMGAVARLNVRHDGRSFINETHKSNIEET
jgi:hypothetical protein